MSRLSSADAGGPADPAGEAETVPEVVADQGPSGDETPASVDDARQAVLDALATELGDDIVGTDTTRDDMWVRVRPEAWRRAAETAKMLGFDYFCFLSGLDWAPSTSVTRGEVSASDPGDDGEEVATAAADAADDDAEAAEYPATTGDDAGGPGNWHTGYAGGDSRFQMLARLYSIRRRLGITLKADLDEETPSVETWSQVYPGADWHERETAEMFGFDFVGHPNLIKLYLPGEFEGFPLRKDFPLLSREVKPWPGLVDVEPMPEEAEEPAAPTEGEQAATEAEATPAASGASGTEGGAK